MNVIKLITAIVLIGAGSIAAADFKTVSRAYEVPFETLRVPTSTNGTIQFRSCKECEDIVLRATVNTRYVFNGEDLSLADFRRTMYRIRNEAMRSYTAVTVLHHLETDTLVSVKVTL